MKGGYQACLIVVIGRGEKTVLSVEFLVLG